MSAVIDAYRWDVDAFVRAFDAGIFGDQRVELVDGVVVAVTIEPWHGDVTMRVGRALPDEGGGQTYKVTSSSMPAGGSLPDPDCSVVRRDAVPAARLGVRLVRFAAADVPLIVEVGDATLADDLGVKARLYAAEGYPEYWVVDRQGVTVHRDPTPTGYATVLRVSPGQRLLVPYAPGVTLDVAALVAED